MNEKEKAVIESAKVIAGMKKPSIESLLRGNGFNYEADKIAELVKAVQALTEE